MKQLTMMIGIGAALGVGLPVAFTKANKYINSLSNAISDIKKKQQSMDAFKAMDKDIQNLSATIVGLKNKQADLNKSIKNAKTNEDKSKINSLEKEYKKLGATIERVTKERDKKKNQSEIISENLKKEGINVKNLAKEYEKLRTKEKRLKVPSAMVNAGQSLVGIGSKMSEKGSAIMRKAGIASIPFVGAIKAAAKNEYEYAEVKKLASFKSKEEANAFKSELEKLVTEKGMAISSTELYASAASGFQAGLSKEEVIDYVENASKMAVSFGTDADTAAHYLYAWRNAFNMSLPEIKTLTDQINALAASSGASEIQLSNFLTDIANAGKIAGFSEAQIAAMGATLIEMGMSSEEAATGAKKVFNSLANGVDGLSKEQMAALEKTGVNIKEMQSILYGTKDEKGNVTKAGDADAAMKYLFTKVQNLPKEQIAGVLNELMGERGKIAAANISNNFGNYEKHAETIKDKSQYEGLQDKQYNEKAKTNIAELKNLKARFQLEVAANLGTTLLPLLKTLTEYANKLMTKFSEFNKKNPEFFQKLLPVLAKGILFIGTFGAALKGAGVAIQGAGLLTKAAGGLIGFLTNPIGQVIAAVAALIYIGYKLYKNWDKIKAKAQEVWVGIKNKIAELLPKIGEFVDKWWPLLGPFGGILKLGRLVYQNWDFLKQKAGEFKDWAVEKFTAIKDTLASIAETAINAFQTAAGFILGKIQAIIDKIKGIKDAISNALSGGEQQYEQKSQYDLNSQSAYVGYAKGGIVNRPTYAMIGEGGDSEAVIPLNNSQRSKDLYAAAGKYIHSENMPDLYQTATKFMSNTANGKGDSSKEAIVYNDNRVINCKDAAGVKEVLDQDKQMTINQFKKMLDQVNSEKIRRGYGR